MIHPLPLARGTALSVKSPLTATAATSLKRLQWRQHATSLLATHQLHCHIPLPNNVVVVVVVVCCIFCCQHNASPPTIDLGHHNKYVTVVAMHLSARQPLLDMVRMKLCQRGARFVGVDR